MARKWKNAAEKRTWLSWYSMRQRCLCPNDKHWKDYGGRGINICKRWIDSFDNFRKDMGNRPKNKTLNRINNDKDYKPSNCRWSTAIHQANNRRGNYIITYKNKSLTLAQWARKLNLKQTTLAARLYRNVPLHLALSKKPLPSTQFKHGTNNGYNSGCRCNQCKEFNRNKSRIYRLKVKEKGLSSKIKPRYHGTRTGYDLYKCRCSKCVEMMRIKNERYRKKIKEMIKNEQ